MYLLVGIICSHKPILKAAASSTWVYNHRDPLSKPIWCATTTMTLLHEHEYVLDKLGMSYLWSMLTFSFNNVVPQTTSLLLCSSGI